ncbi:M23 family metallopeptidase [Streptomyces sp. NPDC048664]|uniref:M23 family metallopeptidase n=1 Tax=Streptomyces sp. NPDC048664 TaxID=3154505 RepID=UPI003445EC48
MNDRHPSGIATPPAPAHDATSAHDAPYGEQSGQYGAFTTYADHSTTGYPAPGHATGAYAADPLFGDFPADGSTGAYDVGQWATDGHAAFGTGTHQTPHYDQYTAQHYAAYDTGLHDTTAWATGHQQIVGFPAQGTSPDVTGQWDAQAWQDAGQTADPTQQWQWGTQTFDTGAYDATQWNSAGVPDQGPPDQHAAPTATFGRLSPDAFVPEATTTFDEADLFGPRTATDFDTEHQDTGTFGSTDLESTDFGNGDFGNGDFGAAHLAAGSPDGDHDGEPGTSQAADGALLLEDQEEFTPAPAPRADSRGSNRSRRRSPAKRSALLTVAVPSVCVMGVAGIAAASVGMGGEDAGTATASAATPVKPSVANVKLDSQLESLSAGANDFADRASRTQERIDLKAQQVAEKKKAAAEAAQKERMRPKFLLPVTQKGLSAYFGQAGINWMSVHTGIDFPVSYGTTVMAATDGTVETKWNSAYGNMLILTAKDGTQTWYCHLSSYRVAPGTTVKAGEPIAYSGNSGNSTGPHLHFEVRPGGGAPIDPLPWLRSHGLDPT